MFGAGRTARKTLAETAGLRQVSPFWSPGPWRRLVVQRSQIVSWKKASVIGAETARWMPANV